jgi:hypothetical protein
METHNLIEQFGTVLVCTAMTVVIVLLIAGGFYLLLKILNARL